MRILTIIATILIAFTYSASAQQYVNPEVAQHQEFKKLMVMLEGTLPQIPMDIRRVTFMNIDYASGAFSQENAEYMKTEIDRVISNYGSISIISISELNTTPVLEITGSDTSITITNRSPASLKSADPLAILEIMKQYRIQGIMSGTIRYSQTLGYSLTLRITRPESREVVWTQTIETREFEPDGYTRKNLLISVGAGANSVASYTNGGATFDSDITLIQYQLGLAVRQPFNRKNSGYIALQGGAYWYSLMNSSGDPDFEEFGMLAPYIGLKLQKTLYGKNEYPGDYWGEIFISGNAIFPPNSQTIFYMNQGLIVNLSRGISLGFDLNLNLTSRNVLEDNSKQVTLNTIGYGIRAILRP